MSTFRKYEQKLKAVKILAAAIHFPLKIPRIPFFPFFEGISLNKVATAQNIKNLEDNFLETLIRMIHVKFQTSMTMLRRVDAFCVISQKKGFFPL